MGTRAGVNFLALLTVAANAAVLAALVLGIGGRVSPALGRARHEVAVTVAPLALWFAAIVAIVATAGSLWFSEGAHFLPCKLCWYQRAAMYPMAALLPIAAVRNDRGFRVYAWTLAGAGFVISTYHYLVEWFPTLESTNCDPNNPCTLLWFDRKFGYISIPYMAGSAFALIAVLLFLVPRRVDTR